jgi:prefoldin subunit 5
VCEVSAILRTHIEQLERSYMEAISRILDRLEQYQERRIKAIQEALRDVDIEQERERIKRIMSEIREKNGRVRP